MSALSCLSVRHECRNVGLFLLYVGIWDVIFSMERNCYRNTHEYIPNRLYEMLWFGMKTSDVQSYCVMFMTFLYLPSVLHSDSCRNWGLKSCRGPNSIWFQVHSTHEFELKFTNWKTDIWGFFNESTWGVMELYLCPSPPVKQGVDIWTAGLDLVCLFDSTDKDGALLDLSAPSGKPG